jgi:VWFA-related protein
MMNRNLLLAALGVCSALMAQTAGQGKQAPVPFRAEARLVVVDAVVTDKKGASVHGLAAKDFHIFEDGKEQSVAGFSSQTGPATPVATPVISRRRYFVLFFDDKSLGMADQGWVRQAALKFIAENAGPDRLIAVMENEWPNPALRVKQAFTADVARLQEVVSRTKATPSSIPFDQAVGEPGGPPPALLALAKDLTDVPGRKVVAYFSGRTDAEDSGNAGRHVPRPFYPASQDPSRDPLVFAFRKANVAIYPIGYSVGCTTATGWLDNLAMATGGLSICRGNEPLLALNDMVREQDESYSLGYVPADSPEGSCHVLKVTVDRPGVSVRARPLYCNIKPVNLVATNPLEKELENLAASAAPGASGATVAVPFFFESKDVARVNVALEIPSPVFDARKLRGKLHADLDVLGLAYTLAGGVAARFSDKVGYDFDTQQELDTFRQKPLHYEHQFDMASGNYNFKVVYRSAKDSFGKVETPLAVDFYDPAQLSLSAIALSREVRPVTASDSVDGVLAEGRKPLVFRGNQIVVSGSDRLQRSGLVEAYLEVYEPLLKEKNPVQLGLRLRLLGGTSGEQKWDSGNVNLSGLAQAGDAVIPVALRLPVAGLAPGAYRAEFTVEDSAGGRAVREAEFRLE